MHFYSLCFFFVFDQSKASRKSLYVTYYSIKLYMQDSTGNNCKHIKDKMGKIWMFMF